MGLFSPDRLAPRADSFVTKYIFVFACFCLHVLHTVGQGDSGLFSVPDTFAVSRLFPLFALRLLTLNIKIDVRQIFEEKLPPRKRVHNYSNE